MEIHIRKPNRSISLLLPATFLVGMIIGFTLCYAIYAPSSGTAEPPVQVAETPDAVPPETAPPTEPASEPSPTETPAAPAGTETEPTAMAYLDENQAVWPARHLFIAVKGSQLDSKAKAMLAELKPGGVVLTQDNISNQQQTIRLVSAIKEAVGFGSGVADLPLVAADQEGGPVNRLRLLNNTGARELGKKRDLAAARETGKDFATSAELRGIGVLLAPVMDVAETGTNRDLALRTFGEDSKVVTSLGISFAAGVMDGHILPVVKHFPGHGAVAEDSHDALAVMKRDAKDLPGVVFPFSEAARAGIPGIMVGHIAVPSLDPENPNRPASLSPKLIKELIRDRWNYDGVVISDDLAMRSVVNTANTLENAAVQALAAGCDAVIILETNPERIRAVCQAIDDAVAAGTLLKADLAKSKQRLDQWQIWLRNPAPLPGEVPPLPEIKTAQAPIETVPVTETPTAAEPDEATEAPTVEGEVVYVVKKGDVLNSIAKNFGVSVKDIQTWNNKSNTRLNIGDELVIKTKTPAPSEPDAPAPEPAPETPPTETPPTEPVAETPPAPEASAATEEPAPVETTAAPPAEPTAEEAAAETEEPEEPEEPEPEVAMETGPPPAMKKVMHTIAPGEFPGKIAQKYSIPVADLFKWNGITDGRIRAGDALVVYVPADAPFEGEPVTAENAQPSAEPPAPAEEETAPKEEAAVDQPPETEVYVVKAGETLMNIATQFNTTRQELVELNKLDNPNRLGVGQKLFVPKKAE